MKVKESLEGFFKNDLKRNLKDQFKIQFDWLIKFKISSGYFYI